MRKRGGIIVAVTVLAGLLFLTPIGRVIVGVILLRWQLQSRESAVTAPNAYEPAAVALAKLCQSDPSLFSDEDVFRPAWSPVELMPLKPSSIHVEPDGARVEFGGGFHHFGYYLSLDKAASTSAANVWVLGFYSEGSKSRVLHRFLLDKSDRLELPQYIDRCMTEYHRRSSAAGRLDDRDVRSRLKLLFSHGQYDLAVDSVRDFAAKYQHDWLDHLLTFVIEVRRDDAGARRRLEAWAGRENDFSSWLLAAYAYDKVEDADAAETCVKRALGSPPNDPKWIRTHARHRGASMCVRLYEARRYETCVLLCDALLNYAGARDHLEPELKMIRGRAQRAVGSTEAPPAPPLQDGFDPFEGVDLVALREAARRGLPTAPTSQPR